MIFFVLDAALLPLLTYFMCKLRTWHLKHLLIEQGQCGGVLTDTMMIYDIRKICEPMVNVNRCKVISNIIKEIEDGENGAPNIMKIKRNK